MTSRWRNTGNVKHAACATTVVLTIIIGFAAFWIYPRSPEMAWASLTFIAINTIGYLLFRHFIAVDPEYRSNRDFGHQQFPIDAPPSEGELIAAGTSGIAVVRGRISPYFVPDCTFIVDDSRRD